MTSNPIVTLFYRRLLELDQSQDPTSQLEEGLRLLLGVTSASAGYLELFGETSTQFSCVANLSAEELALIRAATSRGFIAHAIAEGRAFDMSAAARELPPELAQREVAVCCAPISRDTPIGLVYLHRSRRSFAPTESDYVKLFARRIAPLCAALLPPRPLDEQISAYKRAIIRQELQRNDWNMTMTARSLRVGRAALYRALQRK